MKKNRKKNVNVTGTSNNLTTDMENITIIGWLKKIFSIKVISFIVALAGLGFGIWDHCYHDEMDEALKLHTMKIESVEKQIQKNKSIVVCDTLAEVQKIYKLINNSTEFTALCRGKLNSYKDKATTSDARTLVIYLTSKQSEINKINETYIKCNESYTDLLTYSINIEGDDYLSTDILKINECTNMISSTHKHLNIEMNKAIKLAKQKKVKACCECIKNAYASPEYLEFLNSNLDLLLMYNQVAERRLFKFSNESMKLKEE